MHDATRHVFACMLLTVHARLCRRVHFLHGRHYGARLGAQQLPALRRTRAVIVVEVVRC